MRQTIKKSFQTLFIPVKYVLRILRKTNITFWIIIFMIIGFLIGMFAPKSFSLELVHISNIFLYMVKSLITPLIFSTLVMGIAGHGEDLKKIGKLAVMTIIYFEVVTTLALVIGLIAVNIVGPGIGVQLESETGSETKSTDELVKTSEKLTWSNELYKIIPTSFFKSASENEILQIVFCSIMFAVAIIKTDIKYRKPMLDFLDSLSQIMFKVTELVMNFAPVGIGAALAYTIGKNGLQVLVNLSKLVATLYVSLIIYVLIVLVPVLLLTKIPMWRCMKAIGKPALIAFSTSSSEAALPIAMENLEKFGCPRSIVGFVLPTGYSFNLDGTTLYLALASVFCAQAGNVDMPISQQIIMMFSLMLSSKGVAAVPRASLVVLSGTVTSFKLPLEAVAVIMGVDALMDMGRTAVNLTGNCVATIAMSAWNKELDFRLARGELTLQEREAEEFTNNSNSIKDFDTHVEDGILTENRDRNNQLEIMEVNVKDTN